MRTHNRRITNPQLTPTTRTGLVITVAFKADQNTVFYHGHHLADIIAVSIEIIKLNDPYRLNLRPCLI